MSPENIDTLPRSLRLFPLAGALLLPRGTLPLHIFEPRYLAMFRDAEADDRLIGMVQPLEDAARPALFTIGCAGRIASETMTPDGRRFVTLAGICRFDIVDELPLDDSGYRRANVRFDRFVDDLSEEDPNLDSPALFAALRAYFRARAFAADWQALEKLPGAVVVNLVSMMCPFEPREKQALLEARSLVDRARVLTTLLDLDATSRGPAASTLQ